MKILFILLLNVTCLIAFSQETQLYETINYQTAVKNGTRSKDGKPGLNYWQNHADYSISVRLDTASNKIFGKETVVYYNESPDSLRRIILRLYPDRYKVEAIRNIEINPENIHNGLSLDTVLIDKVPIQINNSTTRKNGTNLSIMLTEKLAPNQKIELYCEWNYKLPHAYEFRREGLYKKNAWFVGYFYPQVAVYDDMEYFYGIKGWDLARFHMGLQEFYNDFNNYTVSIEVPEGFFVWATGELSNPKKVYSHNVLKRIEKAATTDEIVHILKKEDYSNDLLVGNQWIFKASNVTDFGFGTALNYLWDATSVKVGEKRVFVDAAYDSGSKLHSNTINIAASTIKYSSEIFPAIEFPYHSSTTFNGMLGGGMEFPMIANNEDSHDSISHALVTFHEIFHNYFPFMMGINEKRYPFMDEGWAEFYTNHYIVEILGKDPYAKMFDVNNGLIDLYNFFGKNDDFPLINTYSQVNLDNLFYYYYIKPGLAYELFYQMVGREKFISAMKEYVKRWAGKHPTPWDYFYTMNDVLGENYNWFWKAWFFDLGYPDLGISKKEGKIIVERLGQGALPLPVILNVEYGDGQVEIIEYAMDVWKDGDIEFEIVIDDIEDVKSIQLSINKVPDIDPTNNFLKLH